MEGRKRGRKEGKKLIQEYKLTKPSFQVCPEPRNHFYPWAPRVQCWIEESRPYLVSDSSNAASFTLGQVGPKGLRRLKGQTPHTRRSMCQLDRLFLFQSLLREERRCKYVSAFIAAKGLVNALDNPSFF